jgi:putative glutamine amidotransferase
MQLLYVEAVWRAGGNEAIVAPRIVTESVVDDLLSRVDGLVLVGGGDIDPARYGQQPHPSVYDVFVEADELELTLARRAVALGVPTLAICRGMQVLNVALGGTLQQHLDHDDLIEAHRTARTHPVDVAAGTRLAAVSTEMDACWSFHHQVVDQLGDGLMVSAKSADGLIEAIEPTDAAAWVVAVQWHPERNAAEDEQQQALFDELIHQARLYRSGRA